jgi:hypothetical protein
MALLEMNLTTYEEVTSTSLAVVVAAIVTLPEKLAPLAAVRKPVLSTFVTVEPEGDSNARRRVPAAGALLGLTPSAVSATPPPVGLNVSMI